MTALSIDLRQLRYCLAAADHGSFRKAAIRLGVRESTVSRRIRDLEGLLGTALFIRHPGGVRPTEAGQRFGRQTRNILRALGVAMEEARTGRSASDGTERTSVSSARMPVPSACLVCWGADRHPVSPRDRCAHLSRTGSGKMRDAINRNGPPDHRLRSDRATALGETVIRLVEMLGSDP